jgi:hypothetical protein
MQLPPLDRIFSSAPPRDPSLVFEELVMTEDKRLQILRREIEIFLCHCSESYYAAMRSVPRRGSGWVSRLPNFDCGFPIGPYETGQSEIRNRQSAFGNGRPTRYREVILTSLLSKISNAKAGLERKRSR